jgi:hypothetical protein
MLRAHPAMATGPARTAEAAARTRRTGPRATRTTGTDTKALQSPKAARTHRTAAKAPEAARTHRTDPRAAGATGAAGTKGNPGPAGTARAPAADGTSGTSRMAFARGMPRPRRTDRWQVGPRRRVLVVAVRAVGPGRRARRQEFLLGHGAPPKSGCGK